MSGCFGMRIAHHHVLFGFGVEFVSVIFEAAAPTCGSLLSTHPYYTDFKNQRIPSNNISPRLQPTELTV